MLQENCFALFFPVMRIIIHGQQNHRAAYGRSTAPHKLTRFSICDIKDKKEYCSYAKGFNC